MGEAEEAKGGRAIELKRGEREEILEAITKAGTLRADARVAPAPETIELATAGRPAATPDDRAALAGLVERFLLEAAKAGASAERVASLEQARNRIVEVARENHVRVVLRSESPLFDEMLVDASLAAQGMEVFMATEFDPFAERAQSAGLGLTDADYALADTGTLVILSRPGHPRAVSLLPPVHIAVLPVGRLVADLAHLFAVLDLKEATANSSAITFITGPSRTADIEQTLVIGAHGPARVHIILID